MNVTISALKIQVSQHRSNINPHQFYSIIMGLYPQDIWSGLESPAPPLYAMRLKCDKSHTNQERHKDKRARKLEG